MKALNLQAALKAKAHVIPSEVEGPQRFDPALNSIGPPRSLDCVTLRSG